MSGESYSVRPTASWLRQFPALSAEDTANKAAATLSERFKEYFTTVMFG